MVGFLGSLGGRALTSIGSRMPNFVVGGGSRAASTGARSLTSRITSFLGKSPARAGAAGFAGGTLLDDVPFVGSALDPTEPTGGRGGSTGLARLIVVGLLGLLGLAAIGVVADD